MKRNMIGDIKEFKENFLVFFLIFKGKLSLIDFTFCLFSFHLTDFVCFKKTNLMGDLISGQVKFYIPNQSKVKGTD